MSEPLTPTQLLGAYRAGIFPMATARDATDIQWVDPHYRGVFPLDQFHISRSLRKKLLSGGYQAQFDTDFVGVLDACADRPDTWINAQIHDLYMGLFAIGHAHSQEIWDNDFLIGGVYGVTLGQAFFGESMFSRRRDASKVALAWLVDRLRITGFRLFDAQFLTPHLQSLGAIEIDRAEYQKLLGIAVNTSADIHAIPGRQTAYDIMQRNTQTS